MRKWIYLIPIVILITALVTHYYETTEVIYCTAGTEVSINEGNEYPVYSIECDTDKTVLILD